jgi:hypothetical protein
MPNDAALAAVARTLAEALSDFAYSRKDHDQKRVAQMHTELCALWRKEREDDAAAQAAQEPQP